MSIEHSQFREQFAESVRQLDSSLVTVLRCPRHETILEPSDRDERLMHCPEAGCQTAVLVDDAEIELGEEES